MVCMLLLLLFLDIVFLVVDRAAVDDAVDSNRRHPGAGAAATATAAAAAATRATEAAAN